MLTVEVGAAVTAAGAAVAILVGAGTLLAAVAFEGDTAAARHMAGIEAGMAVAEVTVGTVGAMVVMRVMDIEAGMAGAEATAVGAGVAWELDCTLRRSPTITQHFGTPACRTIMRTITTINGMATWVSMRP